MTNENRGEAAAGHEPAAAAPRSVAGVVDEVVLTRAGSREADERPMRTWRVVAQVVAAALVVVALVAVAGLAVSRRLAEAEAVNDAAHRTDLLAVALVQPILTDALTTGGAAALATVDGVVRSRVLDDAIIRVKIWAADGTILYSDEPRLIGTRYPLGPDELAVLRDPATEAEVSDLSKPENVFERGAGQLLEVYRPVWTPNGTAVLFETYSRYDVVTQRSASLWRGFAGVTLSSLLLLVVLLLPVLWALLDRVRRAQEQREQLLRRAVEASDVERRRIAATVHDGVVQELAAASFTVAGVADRLRGEGHQDLAGAVHGAADTIRASIRGLRSLLVEIYPPSLRRAGLDAALTDLVGGLSRRGADIHLELPAEGTDGLAEPTEQVVFRVAQECLRNAVAHSGATEIRLRLTRSRSTVVLEVIDDGTGFDLAATTGAPDEGHFGLRMLTDLAAEAGAALVVATAPGNGCRWRLTVEDS